MVRGHQIHCFPQNPGFFDNVHVHVSIVYIGDSEGWIPPVGMVRYKIWNICQKFNFFISYNMKYMTHPHDMDF